MSWTKTYTHTILLGLDRFGAAIFFNEPDITISSLCWIVLSNASTVSLLKLYGWQYTALKVIGSMLECLQSGHCAAARLGDIETSGRAAHLLEAHVVE